MNQPAFEINSITQSTPFQASKAFSHFYRFEGESGRAFVDPGVAQDLVSLARNALPNETGGLLAGRILHDGDGAYPIVVGFVEAPAGAGQSATFHISPGLTSQLRAEVALRYPAADVIGWWHSHWSSGNYSDTDSDTQRIWTAQESVGLLVFAESHGSRWGTVYLGPDSQPLTRIASPGTDMFWQILPDGTPSSREVVLPEQKTPSIAEQQPGTAGGLSDDTRMTPEDADQPREEAEQPPEDADQSQEEAEQPPEDADQSQEEAEQPPEDADQPPEDAEQPQEDVQQPRDRAEHAVLETGERAETSQNDQEPEGGRKSSLHFRRLVGVSALVALAVLAAFMAITAAEVAHLSEQIHTLARQVNSQLIKRTEPQADGWTCLRVEPNISITGRSNRSVEQADSFFCYLTSPVGGNARWLLNGRQIGIGSSIQVSVSAHGVGHNVLSLVVVDRKVQHSAGSLTLP